MVKKGPRFRELTVIYSQVAALHNLGTTFLTIPVFNVCSQTFILISRQKVWKFDEELAECV